MKVITIGRSEDNYLVLEDNQNMISRQHATLRIYNTGKMEIVSTGTNGTFVNGFRIKPNIPHKVTRKDVISFAHVRQLDWNLIPDPYRYVRWALLGVLICLLIGAIVLIWPKDKEEEPFVPVVPEMSVPQPTAIPENVDKEKDEKVLEEPVGEEAVSDKKIGKKRFPVSGDKKTKDKPDKEEMKEPEQTPQSESDNEVAIPVL